MMDKFNKLKDKLELIVHNQNVFYADLMMKEINEAWEEIEQLKTRIQFLEGLRSAKA